MAYGIGGYFGHEASFFNSGSSFTDAAEKALAHGVSRAALAYARGEKTSSAFWSGFASSAFSVGTKGYGGFYGRTSIMAVVGGTTSELTGGKFANGAVTGAFVHMFNSWGDKMFQIIGKQATKKEANEMGIKHSMANILGDGVYGAIGGGLLGSTSIVGVVPGIILGFSGGLIKGVIYESTGFNSFLQREISNFNDSFKENNNFQQDNSAIKIDSSHWLLP